MKFILITNNELVYKNLYDENSSVSTKRKLDNKIIYDEGFSFIEVLEKTRDFIHQGHVLLSHPMSGSVKPYETPFKSVAVSMKKAEL